MVDKEEMRKTFYQHIQQHHQALVWCIDEGHSFHWHDSALVTLLGFALETGIIREEEAGKGRRWVQAVVRKVPRYEWWK